jgi:allophanate hydrolase subunit 1
LYNATSTCPTSAGSYSNTSTGWTESNTTNNGKYVCIYGADGAGNYATIASTNPINIDVTSPVVTNVTAINANSAYTV